MLRPPEAATLLSDKLPGVAVDGCVSQPTGDESGRLVSACCDLAIGTCARVVEEAAAVGPRAVREGRVRRGRLQRQGEADEGEGSEDGGETDALGEAGARVLGRREADVRLVETPGDGGGEVCSGNGVGAGNGQWRIPIDKVARVN